MTLSSRNLPPFVDDTSERAPSRAGLGSAIASVFVVLLANVAAHGETRSWWDDIPGFTAQSGTTRNQSAAPGPAGEARPPRDAEPASAELRRDAIPMASEETRQALELAISRYQEIVADGGWPMVPSTARTLRPGEEDTRIPVLVKRLAIGGDLVRGTRLSVEVYGAELEAAIKRFQDRHGLKPTGLIDRSTVAAMNVTADQRLAQLRINSIRVRELAVSMAQAERYVLVNAAAFQAEAVEQRLGVIGRHRVINGKPERQTPGVKATIRNINFFPYWHVPDSVAHLDLIPKLQKDPGYLEREKIRVLRDWKGAEIPPESIDWRAPEAALYKFQQDPGPQNALGLVRIDMPNTEAVYMHDTPMKQLFSQRGRSYSAGCVRVEGVFDLVAWILRDVPGWDRARIDQVLAAGQPLDIPLPRPVPVQFTYITAWGNPDGRIDFRPDLYNRDGISSLIASYAGDKAPAGIEALAP